ncbi:MAG: orotidine 5'-phosphate decarboxylase [Candidatus Komeilibacteria bacterium RIFOXYD2_FULL_37_8]|nr:MAG: orotidine 5'-phosphate decarboxylase [Candidatus Komeilibacteria bacterium RIFOXYD1_FULL_37_29]OGY96424.1 MAG: orotidine 5'-phosphate decarboxylase [Candidatus Komeilibacteria bacterium RIFOXYD2_FULL_37_8]
MSLHVAERLIVAADYSPKKFGGIAGVEKQVLVLAKDLQGTGVYIKVNSILRAVGYSLIVKLHDLGVKVFADLKLIDISNTMGTDGELLAEFKPDILTVMCCAGIDGMHAVQKVIGGTTEVLGVTVLTSLNEEECQSIFTCSTKAGVLRFSRMAQLANLGGLILSPQEVEVVSKRFELTLSLNTPGIRPIWSLVEGDDQSRVLTPQKAIANGAKRIVMGRPIIEAGPNDKGLPQSPREAVDLTLKEIEAGLSS